MRAVAFVGLAMAPGRTDAYIIKTARHVSFSKCTATSAQQDRDLVVLTLTKTDDLMKMVRALDSFSQMPMLVSSP